MNVKIVPVRHCVAALFLMALPAAVQAQFTYSINEGSATIIGYTGPGGAVTIPSSTNGYPVVGIADFAFAYSTNLTSISIPASITNIETAPFLGCTSLTNISVNAANPSYSSTADGILVNKWQYSLIAYPPGLANATYMTPRLISNIGDYAFASCSRLTNVSVAVTNLGEFAFYDCSGLASVAITNEVGNINAQATIGAEAFAHCARLATVLFANTITNIGGLAFAFCTNLTSAYFWGDAPPDVGNIFYDDPVTVYFDPGIAGWGATFGGAPTAGETPPTKFSYAQDNGSITITRFLGSETVIAIPASINGDPVVNIAGDSFYHNGEDFSNNGLTSVTIPNSVTNIGDYAFAYCASLTNVVIPKSVVDIGASAFADCSGLSQATIPGGIINIGQHAFNSCTNLASVYFQGNAPPDDGTAFSGDPATVYFLPGTTGWGATFGGAPTELWNPEATALATTGGHFGFNISGPTNLAIVVEACTNLDNPIWLPVSTNTLSGAGASFFSDPQWTNFSNRFYRFSAP